MGNSQQKEEGSISHGSHEHTLSPGYVEKGTTEEECDVCDKEIYGLVYACETCKFSRHSLCAKKQMPSQIIHPSHPMHELRLKGMSSDFLCERCFRNSRGPRYNCYSCDIDVDLACASSTKDQITREDQGQIPADRARKRIKHFSHGEPLALFKYRKTTKYYELDCSWCDKRLSGMSYGCFHTGMFACRFFLHESCISKIPKKLQHPFHPAHYLYVQYNHGDYEFSCCKPECLPYLQTCYACHECKFYLHIHCARRLSTLKHKCHKHSLTYFLRNSGMGFGFNCNACGRDCNAKNNKEGAFYRCVQCDFNVHLRCIPIPPIAKHRYHRHFLALHHGIVEDDSGDFYCDICEEERNPKHHIYYCKKCRYIAHVECVVKEVSDSEVMKLMDLMTRVQQSNGKFPELKETVGNNTNRIHLFEMQEVHLLLKDLKQEEKKRKKEKKELGEKEADEENRSEDDEDEESDDINEEWTSEEKKQNKKEEMSEEGREEKNYGEEYEEEWTSEEEEQNNKEQMSEEEEEEENYEEEYEEKEGKEEQKMEEEEELQENEESNDEEKDKEDDKEETSEEEKEGKDEEKMEEEEDLEENEESSNEEKEEDDDKEETSEEEKEGELKDKEEKHEEEDKEKLENGESSDEEDEDESENENEEREEKNEANQGEASTSTIGSKTMSPHPLKSSKKPALEIQHFSHRDPLNLFHLTKRYENGNCRACWQELNGTVYICKCCEHYGLHKACAELPYELQHPLHSLHSVILLSKFPHSKTRCFLCDECREFSVGFVYLCMDCQFKLDVKCAALAAPRIGSQEPNHGEQETKLLHFSHEHMLVLGNLVHISLPCCGCNLPILGPAYFCLDCLYIIHKSCVRTLPQEIKHPFHSLHPLVASRDPNYKKCHACKLGFKSRSNQQDFIGYGCLQCKLDFHLVCANSLRRVLKSGSHKHNLYYFGADSQMFFDHNVPDFGFYSEILQDVGDILGELDKVRFLCSTCNEKCKGPFYRCVECAVNFHLKCVPIPQTIESIRHIHPFTLKDSFVEDDSGKYYCDICEEERQPKDHIYYCEECQGLFVAHIECVLSPVEESSPEGMEQECLLM